MKKFHRYLKLTTFLSISSITKIIQCVEENFGHVNEIYQDVYPNTYIVSMFAYYNDNQTERFLAILDSPNPLLFDKIEVRFIITRSYTYASKPKPWKKYVDTTQHKIKRMRIAELNEKLKLVTELKQIQVSYPSPTSVGFNPEVCFKMKDLVEIENCLGKIVNAKRGLNNDVICSIYFFETVVFPEIPMLFADNRIELRFL